MQAESLDTIGVFARHPEDLALSLQVLSGRSAPVLGAAIGAPRVGLCRTPRWSEADAATQANLEAAAQRFAQAGAQVQDFEMPEGSATLFDRHSVIQGFEAARALGWEYATHPDQLSAIITSRLEEGRKVTRAEYDEVRTAARGCRQALAEKVRAFDFLLTPSAPSEAPASLESTGDPIFNRAWTLLGVPCVTLPHGKGPRGLPLGVQLVGAFDADMALIAWADWAQRALRG